MSLILVNADNDVLSHRCDCRIVDRLVNLIRLGLLKLLSVQVLSFICIQTYSHLLRLPALSVLFVQASSPPRQVWGTTCKGSSWSTLSETARQHAIVTRAARLQHPFDLHVSARIRGTEVRISVRVVRSSCVSLTAVRKRLPGPVRVNRFGLWCTNAESSG